MPQAEETHETGMARFNAAVDGYRALLAEQNAGCLKLPNDNPDVGTLTAVGKYTLADASYSELLHKLQGHYTEAPPELRSDILAFYHDLGDPNAAKANAGDGARVLQELDQLQPVDTDLCPVVTVAEHGRS
jgi:hypothetical protein